MESFFTRYRNPLLLVALVLMQVIMLASQIGRTGRSSHLDHPDGQSVRLIRLWAETALSPFERAFGAVGHGVRWTWSNYFALRSAKKQNEQLQVEVDRLRLEQAALAEDARQGHRLQALLNFREHYITQTVAAQVIGTSGSDQSQVLYVNKGSDDGIKPDMPVITPDGIVGRVREVFPNTSQILLINDSSSGAGVLLETTRIRGVVRGNGYGQLEIINVMPDDRIKPGEAVIASGGDQIFPRGMPVGTVERVQRDPAHDPYVQVLVTPAANLSRLEEVLIVTGSSDKPPSSMAADVAASEAIAEQQKKAAEVLAEKLPTVKPEEVQANELATGPDRPHQPPQPLHPDRFSVGATPPAAAMQPGAAATTEAETPESETTENAPTKTPQATSHVAAKKTKPPVDQNATSNADDDLSEPAPKQKAAPPKMTLKNPPSETPAAQKPTALRPAPEQAPTTKDETARPPAENSGASPSGVEKP